MSILTALCRMTSICFSLSGHPQIVDGDTLRLASVSIRLAGIDAEEWNEPNGPLATYALIDLIGNEVVHCEDTRQRSYHRIVAVCYLPDGTDIAGELVRRGVALDCARYSHGKYRALEPKGARERLSQKRYC